MKLSKTIPVYGFGVIGTVGESVKNKNLKKALVVYDLKAEKYALLVGKSLLKNGMSAFYYIVSSGEKEKNFLSVEKICSFLYANDFSPSDCIISVGGGVTSDLSGFVASVYKRGIPFYIVPTTLLAMVDSSFGGKTAVDIENGKNIVGSFYPAVKVFVDFEILRNLPATVYSDGYGEILKYALLSETVFSLVCGKAVIFDVVKACVDYKLSIVKKDFYDESKRRVLNLGHTVAHALETLSDFGISHGKAVGQGLYFITDLSLGRGIMGKNEHDKIISFLTAYGVTKPTQTNAQLACAATNDKKIRGDYVNLVLLEKIGKPIIKKIKRENLQKYYEY